MLPQQRPSRAAPGRPPTAAARREQWLGAALRSGAALEPLTPCLQIAVIGRHVATQLADSKPMSDRDVPRPPGARGQWHVDGTARGLLPPAPARPGQVLVRAITPIGAQFLGSGRRADGRRSRSRSDAAGAIGAVVVTWTGVPRRMATSAADQLGPGCPRAWCWRRADRVRAARRVINTRDAEALGRGGPGAAAPRLVSLHHLIRRSGQAVLVSVGCLRKEPHHRWLLLTMTASGILGCMTGIVAAGRAVEAGVPGGSITTFMFLAGLFLGALWRPLVGIVAVIIIGRILLHVNTAHWTGADVLVIVAAFAVAAFAIGGPTALRHLGDREYQNRMGSIRSISGIWNFFG